MMKTYDKIFYRKELDNRLFNSKLPSFKHIYLEIILNVVNRCVCLCVCVSVMTKEDVENLRVQRTQDEL